MISPILGHMLPTLLLVSGIFQQNLHCFIGVIFDNCDQMREHITSVCRASHFNPRNIGSIRRYLTPETCATLVHSLISSKLDYCNSLLIELPETQINRLQCIQNSAARIVSRRPRHEHITPVLENLHWLPV